MIFNFRQFNRFVILELNVLYCRVLKVSNCDEKKILHPKMKIHVLRKCSFLKPSSAGLSKCVFKTLI